MKTRNIQFCDLSHRSPEFDAAYDVISREIPPAYLETRDFLKNRLRVRDEGPKTTREKLLVQDGYSLHFVAAEKARTVVGAIYGHLISNIGHDNRGIGFVTYISVLPGHRRQGIGTALIGRLREIVNAEALRSTGKKITGMVFEIETHGKEEIKAAVGKLGARPLDIVYYQPALRPGYEPERMDLWYRPVPSLSSRQTEHFTLDVNTVSDVVRNMLTMEYVGPEMKGFDLAEKPYTAFLESIAGRTEIGFIREGGA